MSDPQLRGMERTWRATGDGEDLSRFVHRALQSGDKDTLRALLVHENIDQESAQQILELHPDLSYLGVDWVST